MAIMEKEDGNYFHMFGLAWDNGNDFHMLGLSWDDGN